MEFQDLEIWSQDPDFGVQNPEFGTYGVWGGQHMGKHMHTLEQTSPRGLMDEGGVQARRAPDFTCSPKVMDEGVGGVKKTLKTFPT